MSSAPLTSRRAFLERAAQLYAGVALLPALPLADNRPPRLDSLAPRAEPDEAYWRAVKAQFPIREGSIPMNAANLCPAPLPVADAVARAARDVDADVSFQNRAKYDALREQVRARLAAYLGADRDEVAIVRNTSEANNVVVGGLQLKADDDVLISDLNHPTNNVAWDVRAKRFGFTVRRVAIPPTPASADEIVAIVRRELRPTTRVLSFTDVSNTTGVRMPTRELCQLARERGIYVHVDGAQTFGALRRDLHGLGADSYAASAHKWLVGPKEAGILYVRRDRAPELWPGVVGVGWGSSADSSLRGALRFETLGQRNDATIAGLGAAMDLHEQIGPARVEARVLQLAAALVEGLAAMPGAKLVTSREPALRAGVCVVRFDGADSRKLYETLYTRHGIAGAASGGLRLCPHIYNTIEDIERALSAVREEISR